MTERNFFELLEKAQAKNKSFVCVGLDSECGRIPSHISEDEPMIEFNKAIVDATHDLVCAYKPNRAFYDAMGAMGSVALWNTVAYIKDKYPNIPIILDSKRGDIGNTNRNYAQADFDDIGVDAITAHPYLGSEAMKPFLERENKGIFVLCRTSNKGAGEFQDIEARYQKLPLYQVVAKTVRKDWNFYCNCGLVVGATYPEELAQVREIVGDILILIPGVGQQKGDVEKTVKAGMDSEGGGFIINSSRSIIFASEDEDFAEAARKETDKLRKEINSALGD